MPNDLERAFGALASDTDRAQLLPAAEVRRLSGRRSRNASIAAALTAAVLVAGVTVGGSRLLTGDDDTRPLPPLQTVSPSVPVSPSLPPSSAPPSSAPPSSAPPSSSPPPSSPPAPTLPKSIPARALLNAEDGNRADGFNDDIDRRPPPPFCSDASYPSSSKAAVRRSVMLLYVAPGTPEGNVADDTIYDTVTVFRGDGASEYLDELRAAVRECADAGDGIKHRSLGSFGAGDESLMIERSRPATDLPGDPLPGEPPTLTYLAAARVGDTVALVECAGYENWGSKRDVCTDLGSTAAERVADWR